MFMSSDSHPNHLGGNTPPQESDWDRLRLSEQYPFINRDSMTADYILKIATPYDDLEEHVREVIERTEDTASLADLDIAGVSHRFFVMDGYLNGIGVSLERTRTGASLARFYEAIQTTYQQVSGDILNGFYGDRKDGQLSVLYDLHTLLQMEPEAHVGLIPAALDTPPSA